MTHEQFLTEKLKDDPEALKRLEAFKQECIDVGKCMGIEIGAHNESIFLSEIVAQLITQRLQEVVNDAKKLVELRHGGCSHE